MALPGKKSIDMTTGTIADKILLFAIPLMASSMLQLLFNAVDVIVVGQFVGKEALAAVGSNTSLINLLVAVFVGLSVGANVVIARDLGAKNFDAVSRSVHTAIFLALVSGLIMGIFGSLMSRQFLTWMSSPADVIDLATQYLRVYFLGMPGFLLYNFGAAILRAKGDTQRPLLFLIIAGVTNVILNLIFVVVFHLSVVGVALATIISQYISAGLILRCLVLETDCLHLNPKQLCLDPHVIQRILSIGLPAGFQSILFSLSNILIQSTVNSFGSTMVSGAAAAASIEAFVYMGMNSFHQAAMTFVGQNCGARLPRRVDRIIPLCLLYVVIFGLVAGNLAYWNGHFLLGLYAPGEEEVIAAGMIRLSYIGRLYCLAGLMDVMVGALRGLGQSVIPMLVTLVGVCGLRIAWIFWVFPQNPVPENLFVSYPITWTITFIVLISMFFMIRPGVYRKLEN